jgi:hypothetical protein
MDQFPLVYRCAVIVKPKQPFLNWLNKVELSIRTSLEELQRDCHMYLVPNFEEVDVIETAIEKYLRLNYSDIFINELTAWYTDNRKFPKFSYALFIKWFDISMNTMIFDTVNLPIEKDEEE